MKLNAALILGAFFASTADAGLLITEVVGKVEVGTSSRAPLKTLDEVPDGAWLTLAAGARVVAVELASGNEFQLAGSGRYRVAADGPRDEQGQALRPRPLPANNLPAVRIAPGRVAQATMVMRSVMPRPEGLGEELEEFVPAPQHLVAPVRTSVVSTTPTLRWKAVELANSYRITLNTPYSTSVFFAGAGQTEFTVPADQALPPGSACSWRLEARLDQQTVGDETGRFRVAPQAVIDRLNRLKPGAGAGFAERVLYAAQLQEAGARDDANALWQALAAERPDDEGLRRAVR